MFGQAVEERIAAKTSVKCKAHAMLDGALKPQELKAGQRPEI